MNGVDQDQGSTKADPYGWVPAVIGNGNMPGYCRGRQCRDPGGGSIPIGPFRYLSGIGPYG